MDTDHRCITKVSQMQFPELDRIRHGADVVGQSVPGGMDPHVRERPLAELRGTRPWQRLIQILPTR